MNSFMRGEKPEVANPIVAWASQTGKGLLFFNKKGNSSRTSPDSVLPLYDASEVKKSSNHEITFKIAGHEHTLKAANDTERDGWYASIEKAAEVGKVLKSETRESEGYKAEMDKLSTCIVVLAHRRSSTRPPDVADNVTFLDKPNVVTPAPSAATPVKSKKSTDTDRKETNGSGKKKSRSTSRGLVDRLKSKKDDMEHKKEEKKEEKELKNEEKKEENSEKKEEEKELKKETKDDKVVKDESVAKDSDVMPVAAPVVADSSGEHFLFEPLPLRC